MNNVVDQIENYNKKEIYDINDFKWNSSIEEYSNDILNEYLAFKHNIDNFLVENIDNEQDYLTNDKKWKMILLKLFDKTYLLEHFKKTHEALKKIPNCINAFISILEPNSIIP